MWYDIKFKLNYFFQLLISFANVPEFGTLILLGVLFSLYFVIESILKFWVRVLSFYLTTEFKVLVMIIKFVVLSYVYQVKSIELWLSS